MANDLRFPAAVAGNLVRALRKRADILTKSTSQWHKWSPEEKLRFQFAREFSALADELEAGPEPYDPEVVE